MKSRDIHQHGARAGSVWAPFNTGAYLYRAAYSLLIITSLALLGCDSERKELSMSTNATSQTEQVLTVDNPFRAPSPLYLQAPPFDKIKDSHYMPAFLAGIKEHMAEIRAIADNPQAPTFENTIVAMERAGAMLHRVSNAFGIASGTNLNDTIQQVDIDTAPLLSQHHDNIILDDKLFARIHAVYEQRESLGLDPVSKRLLEEQHDSFARQGALLSKEDKARLRAMNEELSKLSTHYSKILLEDTVARAVVVDSLEELDGLSESDIEAAAAAAQQRNLTGKWVIPLVHTTDQPCLSSLKNRALRERIYRASIGRVCHGGETDTRKLIARTAQLRAQKAKLLGYETNADYVLSDQMAKKPAAAMKLLTTVANKAAAQARLELADMQAIIDKEGGGFKLQPWDWKFYAEKVRKEKYDLDESEIRPYFEMNNVVVNGMFFAAERMYGITFKERTDIPAYDPDAQVWEVFDRDGSTIGLFYTDLYARSSKRGGAWMGSLVDQSELIGTKPVIINELNVPKPSKGQPTLLTFNEVITFFHEFGHGLHGLLSKVKYPSQSGTSTPRDFVEYPAQFQENSALDPVVLANYAKHYKTGAPIPQELVEKIKKSSAFNQGFFTLEYCKAAIVDLEWHALTAADPVQDPIAFEEAALRKHNVDMAEVPPRYHTWYFTHIWANGYHAGYYAYLWTAVIAADNFAWFEERGGMSAENGQLYRDAILSRGGTKDPHQMYLDYRGQEPAIEPLLRQRGFALSASK